MLISDIGIGAAVARAFAQQGCSRLAITDVNRETLFQTRDAILAIKPDAEVYAHSGDVSDEKDVESFVTEASRQFGRLDYAVNCAGILGPSLKSADMNIETFDTITRVNYRGSWLYSRAALKVMLNQQPLSAHPEQRGAVVNIASQLGIVARPEAGERAPSSPDGRLSANIDTSM